jgi:biuret amidohydrolase
LTDATVLGVERLHGLEVPRTLAEACRPERLALVVYDMQGGILAQIDDRERVVSRVREVLDIARGRGIRTFFTRHVTLPPELMGAAQLRLWRTWQRVGRLEDIRSPFPPDAPQTQIVPELAPTPQEAVFDKLTFSAFVGSPLELALRGSGVLAVAVVGVATEIGIEPTVRHAGDLGFVPVVITDACAAGDKAAGARAMQTLEFLGDALITDVEGFRAATARMG